MLYDVSELKIVWRVAHEQLIKDDSKISLYMLLELYNFRHVNHEPYLPSRPPYNLKKSENQCSFMAKVGLFCNKATQIPLRNPRVTERISNKFS